MPEIKIKVTRAKEGKMITLMESTGLTFYEAVGVLDVEKTKLIDSSSRSVRLEKGKGGERVMCEQRRKVEISSHAYFRRGCLVGYTKKNEKMFAVVETESEICTYELNSRWQIEFKEWKE